MIFRLKEDRHHCEPGHSRRVEERPVLDARGKSGVLAEFDNMPKFPGFAGITASPRIRTLLTTDILDVNHNVLPVEDVKGDEEGNVSADV